MWRLLLFAYLSMGLCNISLAQAENEIGDLETELETYSGPDTGRVNRLNELGYRLWIIDPSRSVTLGEEALELARASRYRAGEALAERVMGVGHWARGNYELAYRLLLDARENYTLLGDSLELANTELNIGMVYAEQQEYDLAARSYQRALEAFRRLDKPSREATTYTKIADVLTQQDQFTPAFEYLRRALSIHEQNDFTYGVGEVNVKLGQLFLRQEEYDQAISHFLLGIGAGAQRFDHVGIGESFYGIGLAYLRNGNYDMATTYLERAENMAEVVGLLKVKRDVSQAFRELSVIRGDYRQALEYADRSQRLTDTLFNQELTALMANYEARRKYVLQQEELERATTDLELLEQKRRNDRLTRWILLLILLLVSGTAWFLIKLKDRVIDRKREDIRTSRNHAEALQEELQERERKLTANALSMAQKSEAITELKTNLDGIRGKVPTTVRGELRKLARQVDTLIDGESEWDDFRTHFEAVHPQLIADLKRDYPALTQSDVRLISLLRLNLNTKEIGSILGISPDSVKTARYRLRKKLDLPSGTKLYDFLLALG